VTVNKKLGWFGWLAPVGLILLGTASAASAQVQVDSTDPSAAPQGTVNLDVTIHGNGFKKGATAKWFVTGTTNPGGVAVNSTSYRSSSELIANITVAADATIAGFDVMVFSAGRTGKGTDLFAVTAKGTPLGCSTLGTPGGFTLVTELNPVQPSGAALITTGMLGNAIRVRPLDLNGDHVVDTLVTFVTSGGYQTGVTYLYLLDPVTGLVQTSNPVTGLAWQNPIPLLAGVRGIIAAAGDVNGDGIPDFVMADQGSAAYLFVGGITGSYTLSYTVSQIPHPATAGGYWAIAFAMGDLDNDGSDEIVIGARPAKGEKKLPAVFIHKYLAGSAVLTGSIADPTGNLGSLFGGAIAIGNINGVPGNELVVGAKSANANGVVYVYPYPAAQSTYFTLPGSGSEFGLALGLADVTGDTVPDLVVFNSNKAFLYPGPVFPGQTSANQLVPAPGLEGYWARTNNDIGTMLTTGAIAAGAGTATTDQSCFSSQGGVGAVHLFTAPFATSQYPNYVFQPPDLVGSTQFQYGSGVGLVPGYPFLIIGEHLRAVGTTGGAGQVYVYKKY
jgi:hypothetical protein